MISKHGNSMISGYESYFFEILQLGRHRVCSPSHFDFIFSISLWVYCIVLIVKYAFQNLSQFSQNVQKFKLLTLIHTRLKIKINFIRRCNI
jgi:hypothetical protein